MRVVKIKSQFGLDVAFAESEKYISFNFGGNGDLYWCIHNRYQKVEGDYRYDYFIITKENYMVFRLFEKLFYDIENINIFETIDREEKNKYKLHNYSNYNQLFDVESNTITWYSDETAYDVANILKITKEKNIFKIEFYTQPYIEGYDRDFHTLRYIPIRFRNSGSRYDPFNIIFMRMYNDMKELDDVKDAGHQIHIEEYLNSKKQVKKLTSTRLKCCSNLKNMV